MHFPKNEPFTDFPKEAPIMIPYNAFHTLYPGSKLQLILAVVSFIAESTSCTFAMLFQHQIPWHHLVTFTQVLKSCV